jgi:hypothetical protein
MKDIIILTLVEELEPILTRATVMPESRRSDYICSFNIITMRTV